VHCDEQHDRTCHDERGRPQKPASGQAHFAAR
jgi:hypothetical protein